MTVTNSDTMQSHSAPSEIYSHLGWVKGGDYGHLHRKNTLIKLFFHTMVRGTWNVPLYSSSKISMQRVSSISILHKPFRQFGLESHLTSDLYGSTEVQQISSQQPRLHLFQLFHIYLLQFHTLVRLDGLV